MQNSFSIAKKLLALVCLAAMVTVGAQTFETTSHTYFKGGDSSDFTVDVKVTTEVGIGAYTVKVAFDEKVVNFVSGDWKIVPGQTFGGESKNIKRPSKGGSVNLYYSFDTPAEAIPAGTKDAVIATLNFTLAKDGGVPVAETLATGKAFDFEVTPTGEWLDISGGFMDPTAVSAVNGAFYIVKAFNAADVTDTVNDWDGSAATIAASKFSYTDDKGAAVSGSVTGIGEVTCSIPGIDFGSFDAFEGGIKWTPAAGTKAAIGHKAAVFTVPFSATGEKGGDDATLTLTVNPANAAPKMDSFNIVKNTESDSFVIEIVASDADGDPITFADGGYAIDGGKKAGAFVDNVWTSTDVIAFTEVDHKAHGKFRNTTFSFTMSDGIATLPVTVDVTLIDQDQLPTVADFAGASVTITPAAPTVTDTLEYELSGAPIADADGDDFIYSYAWSKPAPYTKKDVVTLNVTATTNPYGEGETEALPVASNSVVIANSAPVNTVATGSLFVLRDGTNKKSMADFVFNVTDADGWEDIVINGDMDIMDGQNGKLTIAVVQGADANTAKVSLSYELKDVLPEDEIPVDTFTVSVFDTDGETAQNVDINVIYQANPPPVVTIEIDPTSIDEMVDGEGGTFIVTATATDKDVYPAGVSAWKLEVPEGWTYECIKAETGTVTSGTFTGTASWTVTCKGYDTITGSPRKAAEDFPVKVTVVDAGTSAEGSAEKTVTVNDVDRLPSAPAAISLLPLEPVHGSVFTAEGNGATDEDGDAITYVYAWAYSTDGGETFIEVADETGAEFSKAEAIKKGYIVKATSFAVTNPYGDAEVRSAEGTATDAVVGNTAPYFTSLGDREAEDAEDDLEFPWVMDEDSEEVSINALALDVDEEDGRDSLIYAVSELDEEIGTLAIDAATGAITFKPAADFTTAGLEELPSFEVTVTDESAAGATNTATVYLQINEVNDKPVILAEDEYVQPDELGAEMSVDYEVVMGPESEKDQELIAASLISLEDPDQILEEDSVSVEIPGYNTQSVTLNYTVKEDAQFGKSAKVTFTVTDDGKPNMTSDPVTVTIFVGATPWYPIISFECADPEGHADGHTFHLEDSDDNVYDIVVKGERTELLPGDYAAIGHPGYQDGAEIKATIFVWTMDEGTTDVVCEEKEIKVTEYGLPYEPALADEKASDKLTANEKGWFTLPAVTAPMAQSYLIVITDNTDAIVKEIGPVDFEANEDGIILPNIEGLELQLTEAGDYSISFQGFNPNGEGALAKVLTVEVPQSSEEELVWGEGDFLPANGSVLTNGSVKFSWPVAAAADSYTVKVFDAYGYVVAEESNISATNAVFDLAIAEKPETYSWNVTAVAGSKTLTSDVQNFTLAKTTSTVIVTEVLDGKDDTIQVSFEGILAEGISIAFDYQYFSVEDMAWYNGTAEAVGGVVTIRGVDTDAGDYVVLRLIQDGRQVGDWFAYQVQGLPR